MIKIGVKIMPREVILDTQGRAVEQSLKDNGFNYIISTRVGKYIEVVLDFSDPTQAKTAVEKILHEGGLFNPLIEKYELQLN
jgi:phosphoribosylformylglycinamidine synthase PurS subunit